MSYANILLPFDGYQLEHWSQKNSVLVLLDFQSWQRASCTQVQYIKEGRKANQGKNDVEGRIEEVAWQFFQLMHVLSDIHLSIYKYDTSITWFTLFTPLLYNILMRWSRFGLTRWNKIQIEKANKESKAYHFPASVLSLSFPLSSSHFVLFFFFIHFDRMLIKGTPYWIRNKAYRLFFG